MDPRTRNRSIALAAGAALALSGAALAQSGNYGSQGQQGNQDSSWYQEDKGWNQQQQQRDTWSTRNQQGQWGNQGQSGQGWNQGMGQQGQRGQMGQRSQSQRGQMGQQGQQQPEWNLSPDGYVYVAYDVDQDGTFDYYEAIWYLDLEKARQGTQGRQAMQQGQGRQQQGQQGRQQQGWQQQGRQGWQQQQDWQRQQQQQGRFAQRDQRGQRSMWDQWNQDQRMGRAREAAARTGMRGRQPARYEVQGEIEDTRKVELIGQREEHVVARIKTQQGNTAMVDLGPAKRVGDLARGERVSVTGTLGKVNTKPVLMAERIEYQGQTLNVEREDDHDIKRFSGRVQSTRKASFANVDGQHMVATVQLDSGQTVEVNLGPAEEFQDVDLQGQQIRFLADGIKMNGQKALRADQVRVGGQKIEIDRSRERERFRSRDSGQSGMQGQSQGQQRYGGSQGF